VPLIGLRRSVVRPEVERVGEQAVSRSGRVIVFVIRLGQGIGRIERESLAHGFCNGKDERVVVQVIAVLVPRNFAELLANGLGEALAEL